MSVHVTCAACRSTFEAGEQHADVKETCPNCGDVLHAPEITPPTEKDCSHRPRSWTWSAAGGGATLIVLTLIGFHLLTSGSTAPHQAAVFPKGRLEAKGGGAAPSPECEPSASDQSKAKIARTSDEVMEAIVKFEMPLPGGMSTGAGFLVDNRGWVATNNHVASMLSTAARAKMSTGQKLELEGIVAVVPERDLAIVKLKELPSRMTLLDISYRNTPRVGMKVFAYGHPQGVDFSLSKGIVSGVTTTGELVADEPTHLVTKIKAPDDAVWIQTDAKILPGSSGGPLLDEDSHVIGVNTFLNVQATYGFASHIKYLKDLVDSSIDEAMPLKSPSEVQSLPSVESPLEVPVSKEIMQQLFNAATAFAWKPTTREDYNTLADLAAMMTASKQPQSPADLGDFADQLFAQLREIVWDNNRIAAINRYAAREIAAPGRGVLFIGTVLDKGNEPLRTAATMILQLPGAADLVLVSPTDDVAYSPKNSRLLLLGIVLSEVGEAELPDHAEHHTLRIIQSHYMLPVKP